MREIRRRTRVVGAFPDGNSCLHLAVLHRGYMAVHPKVHEDETVTSGSTPRICRRVKVESAKGL